MSRRNTLSRRCVRCRMHQSLCVCSLIPRIVTRTRVVLVIHRSELKKPTNTGRLATDSLVNSEMVVRGHRDDVHAPLDLPADSTPLLLYPAEDAVPLVDLAPSLVDKPPVALVVPDGNWRQAFKTRNRVPGLRDLQCVTLPTSKPSIYRLRVEAHEHGLATIEAIARALGILEGEAIESALELPFRAMVERTLWSRGNLDAADVTGGIPEGVFRHDPGSGLAARAR